MLKPFWTYLGGKYRIAPRYDPPEYDTIVEPFAGAAGYSLRHHEKRVVLVEKNPVVAGIWKYLIAATPRDIEGLPRLPSSGRLDDVAWPCDAAKALAGFWITRGASYPNRSASAWMRDPKWSRWSWGEFAIARIASQVEGIKHWTIIEGDYTLLGNSPATWFVDPPYARSGRMYKCGPSQIDFRALGDWCRARSGQVIVCEQEGAGWLPFRPFLQAQPNQSVAKSRIPEVVWNRRA